MYVATKFVIENIVDLITTNRMEAITFESPKSKLTVQTSTLSDRAIHRLILEHHFNHKVHPLQLNK